MPQHAMISTQKKSWSQFVRNQMISDAPGLC